MIMIILEVLRVTVKLTKVLQIVKFCCKFVYNNIMLRFFNNSSSSNGDNNNGRKRSGSLQDGKENNSNIMIQGMMEIKGTMHRAIRYVYNYNNYY